MLFVNELQDAVWNSLESDPVNATVHLSEAQDRCQTTVTVHSLLLSPDASAEFFPHSASSSQG